MAEGHDVSLPASSTAPPPRPQRLAAVALVALTYIYFLLFAQFGFLQGIRGSGLGTGTIHFVLTAMALAGIAASLTAPRVILVFGPGGAMGLGLLLCAAGGGAAGAAFASGLISPGHLAIAAIGAGAGLGLTTVGLAADFRRLTGGRAIGFYAGVGTGLAYFVCNMPALYGAGPVTKAWFVAALALVAMAVVATSRGPQGAGDRAPALVPVAWRPARGLVFAVGSFVALVWFDSAAFAALQLSPEMHDALWGGAAARWTNGGTHAVTAIVGGALLDRGWIRPGLAAAMALLIVGAISFPNDALLHAYAAPLYVTGVSFYSTALAAFAALTPAESGRNAPAWRAAWLYAIGGWFGSAAGVGLAEQTGALPAWAGTAAAAVLVAGLAGARGTEPSAKNTGPPT
jgi:hypothetical protein